jgi:type I restriction enzyme S subunit
MKSVVPPGYKQTEVGVIPEDWEIRTIGDSMRLINGRAFKPEDWKERGIPIIRIQNLNDSESTFNYCSTLVEDRHLIEAGDLLFAWSGTTGTSFGARVWGGPTGVLNQHIFKVIPDQKKLTPAYAFLVLCKVQESIEKQAHGFKASFVHVKKSDLVGVQLPLPPTKAEQETIADTLSNADALIESLEQLIAKKCYIKQGAMQELLTGKKRLPGFSGEWEVKRLGDVAEMGSGGTPPSSVPAYYDGDIPWVSISDMTKGGKVILGTDRSLSREGFSQSAAQMFSTGTVLYAMYASLGECSIAGMSLCTSQAILGIRPKDNLNEEFLYYRLTSLKTAVKSMGQQGTQANLNKGMVQAFLLKLPPILEQTAIATILSDMDAEIATLETKLAKTRQLKQGMMHNLLTGRVRLINPTNATMEHNASNSIECPAAPKLDKPHTWAFNEAVVISVLADQFAKPEFPLGRKRYTKLSYLMHRMAEQAADGYLKKAAGPYNPKTKYAGPERIALENGYIREHQNGKFRGFVAAEKIEQAKAYFTKWYGENIGAWLEQFRRRSNDDLERLATVDMAMQDLLRQGKVVDVASVRALIASEPEWLPKLERTVFSDAGIAAAIAECRTVFGC